MIFKIILETQSDGLNQVFLTTDKFDMLSRVFGDLFRIVKIVAVLLLISFHVKAANELAQTFTLDGQLMLAGTTTALTDSAAVLKIDILDPSKACVLYEETQTVNTTSSDGYFSVQVGSVTGAAKRTGSDPGLTMAQIFQNTTAVAATSASGTTCAGNTYTPTADAVRYFRITVTPSSTNVADVLSPDTTIDAAPMAMVAQTLQGYAATDFIAKAGLPTCSSGTFLSYDGTNLTCAGVSGTSGGTVTSITAGTGLSGGTITTSGTISLAASGVTAGTMGSATAVPVLTVDTYGRITSATTAPLSVTDSSITYGSEAANTFFAAPNGSTGTPAFRAIVAADLPTVPSSHGGTGLTATPSAGQVLIGNGSGYTLGTITGTGNVTVTSTAGAITISDSGGSGTVTSVTGTSPVSVATGTSTPVISISQATTSTAGYLSSTDWNTFNSKLGSSLASGDIFVGNASGAAMAVAMSGDATLSNTGALTLATVATAGSYAKVTVNAKGLVTSGTTLSLTDLPSVATGTVFANVSGSTGTPTAAAPSAVLDVIGAVQGDILYRSATGWSVLAPGTSGQYLQTQGVSANPQWATVASSGGTVTSVTATAPLSVATGTSTPALSISQATTSTNGYLSSTDWNTFNSKMSSSLASGDIFVGNSLGAATAVAMSGDVTMTNTGATTVTKLQGTSVSSTTPTAGQVLRFSGTAWTANFVSMADLRSTITGAQALTSCSASQTLTWSSATDNLACSSIALSDSQITYGSEAANTFLAAPSGGSGTPTFRAIASADLPSGILTGAGTANYVPYYATASTLANSPISISTSGNVGIGTTNPAGTLDVEGGTATSGAGLPITLLAQTAAVPATGGSLGGAVNITAGDGKWTSGSTLTAKGGAVQVKGGTGGGAAMGGTVTLTGGTGGTGGSAATGGGVSLTGGTGGANTLGAAGGAVTISGGSGSTGTGTAAGGSVSFRGGPSGGSGAGGSVTIVGGSGSSTTAGSLGGNVTIAGGSGSYATGAGASGGTLTLTGGGAYNIGNGGATILSGGNANSYSGSGGLAWSGAPVYITGGYGSTEGVQTTYAGVYIQANGGSVGIGTTAPAQILDVYGNIAINGNSVCTSSGCTSSSDRTLKENIQPLQGSLEKVLKLQGVEYDYKDKKKFTDKHQVGVIAQDVEKVYPEVVVKDSKTGLRSVAYDHLIAPVIEAVKVLYGRITSIESHQKNQDQQITVQGRQLASVESSKADKMETDAKIKKLEAENAELKARLEKIEKAFNSK